MTDDEAQIDPIEADIVQVEIEAAAVLTGTAARLPRFGHLEHGNRQQRKRIALRSKTSHPVRCCRCHQPLAVWQKPIFDDGKDAHADCSIGRNCELRKLAIHFAYQDHLTKGTTCPTMPLQTLQHLRPLNARFLTAQTG